MIDLIVNMPSHHEDISRTFSYIIIRGLILHCSLDTIGQETEDGASPQKHGETAKHLRENSSEIWVNTFLICKKNKKNYESVDINDCTSRQDKTCGVYSDAAVTCLQNLTHSGVVGGGVRALGPSRARFSAAFALVKPWHEEEITYSVTTGDETSDSRPDVSTDW